MAKLPPKQHPLSELLENGLIDQEYRPYIGMSSLLGKCPRYLWYGFRWAYERNVNRRTDRIFRRGDIEESRVVAELIDIGCIVEGTGEDQTEYVDETGHVKGHSDGKVRAVPGFDVNRKFLLEVKSMKQAQYAKFLKEGIHKSHPYYWGQVHTYMGEEGLEDCLLVVGNKDTEHRRYMFYKYDADVHKTCMSIAHGVLTAEYPPDKIGASTWFECKFCDARFICHKGDKIKRTCRSCKHGDIEMDGKWSCGLYGQWLNDEDQMLACPDYKLSEVFE